MIDENGTVYRKEMYVQQINRWGQLVTRHKKERVLKTKINKVGYVRVGICFSKDEITWYSIHRLVCLTFLANPEKYAQINHKDGNKLNNHISNLEWCDQSHNIRHAYDTGLNSAAKGWDDTQNQPVSMFKDDKFIRSFGSIGEAHRETKAKRSTISKCCYNKSIIPTGYLKGYTFKFYESAHTF